MTKWIAVFVLVLCASNARAEFTDEEKTELLKLVAARIDIVVATKRVATHLQTIGTGDDRATIEALLTKIERASFDGGRAMKNFFSSKDGLSNVRPPRQEEVQKALRLLGAMTNSIDSALMHAGLLSGANIDKVVTGLNSAKSRLASVSRALPYTDWRPTSYPRNVGPHGDYEISTSTLRRTDEYLHHTHLAGISFYRNVAIWPSSADEPFSVVLDMLSRSTVALVQAWAMDAAVVPESERIVIEADTAAGSGLRPFDFFRLLREVEAIFSTGKAGTVPLFTGRLARRGISGFLQRMQSRFVITVHQAMLVNDRDEIIRWFERGSGNHGTGDPDGRAREFLVDLPDFWRTMDGLAVAWMGFFHEIPAPPGGGGNSVSCGPGTFLQGDVCLPSPRRVKILERQPGQQDARTRRQVESTLPIG